MDKYDSIWKEIIENLFKQFVYFFLPDLAGDIDFKKKYEFLDKELEVISPESSESKRYADKLVKIYLSNGNETWALFHVEIQGYDEKEFSYRMFRYFYRILDKFNRKIVSLAIFTDKYDHFRPDRFTYDFYKTEALFKYRIYKVIDSKEDDLLRDNNPFALAVLAVKYSIESKNDEDRKFNFKRKLMKLMLQKGYSEDEIINMLRFIDVIIELNDEHKEEILYKEFKEAREVANNMIITNFEKIAAGKTWDERFKEGMEKGLEKGRMETAKKMMEDKVDINLIVKYTGLMIEEIKELMQKDRD